MPGEKPIHTGKAIPPTTSLHSSWTPLHLGMGQGQGKHWAGSRCLGCRGVAEGSRRLKCFSGYGQPRDTMNSSGPLELLLREPGFGLSTARRLRW